MVYSSLTKLVEGNFAKLCCKEWGIINPEYLYVSLQESNRELYIQIQYRMKDQQAEYKDISIMDAFDLLAKYILPKEE
jgi:hypothetical protein